ncbi:HNH endonuclease [Escherichia phage DTL]|uniref:Putative endonuclease n=1 Tax=Escherichia phage DTL TaxID=2048061 RepID=A0A2H4PGY6_9CAUD|nr:HNH endonuclease [Escherichia phage DTL]ATW61825.1 putative endonuclease [Escherichia phage DTL]
MEYKLYFNYDNGKLIWKVKKKSGNPGSEAGSVMRDGYIMVGLNRKLILAHRIVWEMLKGPIPEGMEIDHINHCRSDNRIENLRMVSKPINQRNRSRSKNNTSVFTGVCWSKSASKLVSSMKVNGKKIHLGSFDEIQDAIAARKSANQKYKFHKNHGE